MAISERCSYDVIIIKCIVFIECNVIIFIYINLFYCYIVLCYIVRISTNCQDIDLNRVNETKAMKNEINTWSIFMLCL